MCQFSAASAAESGLPPGLKKQLLGQQPAHRCLVCARTPFLECRQRMSIAFFEGTTTHLTCPGTRHHMNRDMWCDTTRDERGTATHGPPAHDGADVIGSQAAPRSLLQQRSEHA